MNINPIHLFLNVYVFTLSDIYEYAININPNRVNIISFGDKNTSLTPGMNIIEVDIKSIFSIVNIVNYMGGMFSPPPIFIRQSAPVGETQTIISSPSVPSPASKAIPKFVPPPAL